MFWFYQNTDIDLIERVILLLILLIFVCVFPNYIMTGSANSLLLFYKFFKN
jgi:hypothetical protein